MDRLLVTCPAAEADAASRCWPHCQNPEVLSWSLPWEQLHGGWGVMITHLLLGGVCSAGVVLKLVRNCGLETLYQWFEEDDEVQPSTVHGLRYDQQDCLWRLLATNAPQILKLKRSGQTFYQNAELIEGLTRSWHGLLRLILPQPLWRIQVSLYHITCSSIFITCLQYFVEGTSKHFNCDIWSCQALSQPQPLQPRCFNWPTARWHCMMSSFTVANTISQQMWCFFAGYGSFYSWSSYPHYQIWIQSANRCNLDCLPWLDETHQKVHALQISIIK